MPRKGKGQALIEFAMIIGVVLILAIGALQGLYAFYVTRQVRAAAEEVADFVAVHGEAAARAGGDPYRDILLRYRLDPDLVEVTVHPPNAAYLEEIEVTLRYDVSVRFYLLFELPIPVQKVQRLSEGG